MRISEPSATGDSRAPGGEAAPARRETGDGSEEQRRRYEGERELAALLREAPPDQRPRVYAEVYGAQHEAAPLPRDPDGLAEQLRVLGAFLRPGLRFLELGAGSGSLTLGLAERVGEAWMLDVAFDRGLPERLPQNVNAIRRSATGTGLPDGGIDLAYSCHLVEHLHPDDVLPHLGEVRRVLTPGGQYLLVTPHRLWGPHDASRPFSRRPAGLHLAEYGYADLAGLFRRAGFRRVQAVDHARDPPIPAPLWPRCALEWSLCRLPGTLRRSVLEKVLGRGRRPPLRRLEQVKVLATRSEGRG